MQTIIQKAAANSTVLDTIDRNDWEKLSDIRHISYAINQKNEIIFVNDGWTECALANNAPEMVAEKVLNRNLWDFISGETTIELYRQLIDKARAGRRVNFNLRCDAPDLRCFLEMKITLRADKNVQFETRLLNFEKPIHQSVLCAAPRRTDNIIVTCSWCRKIKTRDGIWHEIEDAISELQSFEPENTLRMSHGMCVSCFHSISEKHRDTFEGRTGVK